MTFRSFVFCKQVAIPSALVSREMAPVSVFSFLCEDDSFLLTGKIVEEKASPDRKRKEHDSSSPVKFKKRKPTTTTHARQRAPLSDINGDEGPSVVLPKPPKEKRKLAAKVDVQTPPRQTIKAASFVSPVPNPFYSLVVTPTPGRRFDGRLYESAHRSAGLPFQTGTVASHNCSISLTFEQESGPAVLVPVAEKGVYEREQNVLDSISRAFRQGVCVDHLVTPLPAPIRELPSAGRVAPVAVTTPLARMTLDRLFTGRMGISEPVVAESVLVDALIQIMIGVSQLHGLGYLHGDLKWDNILVQHSVGQLKLTDFGTSDLLNTKVAFIGKVKGAACTHVSWVLDLYRHSNGSHLIEYSALAAQDYGAIGLLIQDGVRGFKLGRSLLGQQLLRFSEALCVPTCPYSEKNNTACTEAFIRLMGDRLEGYKSTARAFWIALH